MKKADKIIEMRLGFPGESEAHFNNFIGFLHEISFDHVGVFEYSREKGTDAYAMPEQVSASAKKARRHDAMLEQQSISYEKNRLFVGKTQKVLVEEYDPESKTYTGRSARFAPEVDGKVFFTSKKPLTIPSFMNVRITHAEAYDLWGELVPR